MDLTLYEQADNIIAVIKKSSAYKNMIDSLARFESEANLKEKVNNFNQSKRMYESVSIYGKHHPDYQCASKSLVEAKANLFAEPAFESYLKSLKEINEELRVFSSEIEEALRECLVTKDQVCRKG